MTARRSALLEQLVELFLAHGFRELGLNDLAANLHCSKATLYSLADSKEQLVARVVEYYFHRAAHRVEERVDAAPNPVDRLREYLTSVAIELEAASPAFLRDVAGHSITRLSYERHTQFAADRVRALVAEGVDAGVFDDVHALFVGEVTAAAMDAIERGGVSDRTGLSHAEAYSELASLVLGAVRASTRSRGRAVG